MLTAGMYGWYMTRIDLNSAFLHASLGSQEEIYVIPPHLERWGFTERCVGVEKGMDSVQLQDSGVHQKTLLSLHWSCVSKGGSMHLDNPVLILLSGSLCGLVVKRGLLFLHGVRISGALWGVFSHMSVTCLLQGDIQILQLFVDALKKKGRSLREESLNQAKKAKSRVQECGSLPCLVVVVEFINVLM